MSAFATNQVTQFYAVKSVSNEKLTESAALGAAYVGSTKDGDIYVQYKGIGGLQRTDLIDPCLVKWAKYTQAGAQEHYTQAYTVTPNATVVADNVGKDIILRIDIKNFCGDLSSNHHYFKHAAVKVKGYMVSGGALTTTNTATQPALIALMATQLAKSFGREYDPMIKVMVDNTVVTKKNKPEDITVTANSVIKLIALRPETDPIMIKGLNDELDFDVYCGSYNDAIDEDVWGTVSKTKGLKITNETSILALEDFALKERGDIYGYTGYPYVNPSAKVLSFTGSTDRTADDTATGFDVINIHFAYQGNNEQVHLSEKDIIFAGSASVMSSLKTAFAGKGIKFETVAKEGGSVKITSASNPAAQLVDADSDGILDITASSSNDDENV